MKPNWKPIKVRLGQIKAWDKNPRMSNKAQAQRIIASERKFGQPVPFLISPDFLLYDGHQRLAAWFTVYGADYEMDAMQSDRPLSEDEHKELVITLHTGATGSWNWENLSSWSAGDLQEWGMTKDVVKDWSNDIQNLKELLAAEVEPVDAEPQIDRAAELQEKWQTASGQLWKLGDHRLLIGDCTVRENVERLIGGEKASMCFTSPPYNAGVSAQLSGNTSIDDNLYGEEYDDNQTQSAYFDLLKGFTDNALSVCDYVFVNIQTLAGNKRAFVDYWHNYTNSFCDVAIWDKGRAAPQQAQRVMDSRFEFVLVFGGNGSRAIGTRDFRGMVHNVYEGSPQRHNENADIHAATMPIDLPEHFIRTFTNSGELVYEPFCGTGTTIIAAYNLNRRCFAMEISEKYGAVILQRFLDATGTQPELVE